MGKFRKIVTFLLCIWILQAEILTCAEVTATVENPVEVEAPRALLMEVTTGTVLFEKDSKTAAAPASVTKIMTMLLIFDAIESGKTALTDVVSVSEHAASMGGSQVFLEPFEKQTVETMLKCIAVASANDACVAMAEHICGSEEEFVKRMNERAEELGMENTHFVNCCGLDAEGHVTSAHDIALMSRELLVKYPQVHQYCTIWMENITHVTAKGSQEFGLTNTNKLIRQYEYATGLKTGSTDDAGFCVSASAKKDEIELIAVVMGGETSKSRFADARAMLNFGFANCQIYRDTESSGRDIPRVIVKQGKSTEALLQYEKMFSYVTTTGENLGEIRKEYSLPEEITAPVEEGEKVGEVTYLLGTKKLGSVDLLCAKTVEKAEYMDYLERVWLAWKL